MQRHLLEFPLAGLVRRAVLGFWAGVFKKLLYEDLICNLRMSLGIDLPSCNALSGQERAPASVLLPLGLAPGEAGTCRWRGPRGLFWVYLYMPVVVVVESLRRGWPFATPWTAAHQASLSLTISWSLLKFMSIESVMPSNHLILCYPLLLLPSVFPSIGLFPVSWLFASSGQSIGVSASVLAMNIRGWFILCLVKLNFFSFSFSSPFSYLSSSFFKQT